MSMWIVHCSCPTREVSEKIGWELVKRQLAACVSIQEVALSIYPWDGEVCEEPEFLLLIKTREDGFAGVEKLILQLHPDDVPQILGHPVSHSHDEYAKWLNKSVSRPH